MAKITIELPETFGFTRAGHTFTCETAKFNADIIAQLVMHGATQKIGDAAAGKQGADALTAMQGVYESLSNGDWGRTRGGGAGEEPIMRYIREQVRLVLGEESKKAYKALEPDAKADWLQAKFDGAPEEVQAALREAAEQAMAADVAKREKAKKLAKGMGL